MPTHTADISAPEAATDSSRSGDTNTPPQPQSSASPASKHGEMTSALIFQVDSVEKTEAPGDEQGQDWYRYVLKNRSSTIDGLRRGSRQHVSDYAAEYAEQLNTRILFGPPRWQPRNAKAARTA